MKRTSLNLKAALRASTALMGFTLAAVATSPADAIVINANYTPSQIVDTTNVNGVGQMVIDEENGYLGLCTVSLINPRTVIFASHCVNEAPDGSGFMPASGYGAKWGGLPIGFFFNANNNMSGRSAIGGWYLGTSDSPAYQTNIARNAYNSNYVVYNTNSTLLGMGNNFLQSDVAMAALDTPASNIPTWTLLFSPLSGPTHATITGYGNNGVGANGGSGGIDYRRRSAENIISVLGSLDDQDTFLFGGPDGLPQNLYMMDFNDPKFGTDAANAYDFNIFHDAAQPKEGITAPGDSGGPLIVDQLYKQQVIAAVLSGGYRFFGKQASAGYGSTSFYQPLYLFWDWIVTNNPYKYVSAKAGDGAWTDPAHWVINLDPNYVTASGTTLTNALPTTPAQGTPNYPDVNSPKFGLVCDFDTCVDIATGEMQDFSSPTEAKQAAEKSGGSYLSSSPAQVAVSDFLGSNTATVAGAAKLGGSFLSSQDATTPEGSALVNGVLIQGAPGSSNFVPNDTDGDPTVGAPPRYYDVTLSAKGTTTLSGADITVDRLTINGASTGLTIASGASLTSLIDTTVYAGNFQVNGTYISVGDIALLGGNMSGTGIVAAPNTTLALGSIAPGTVGTIGKLTVNGNVIFASGSGFLTDVSATSADVLDIYGTANLGGTLVVTPVGGYVPKYHDKKTVLYADTITGSFDNVPDSIAGILYPSVATVTVGTGATAYQAEVVTFEAGSYAYLSGLSADQSGVAKLLDSARTGHYTDLQTLYDAIDPLSGDAQGAALKNLAPDAARAVPAVQALVNNVFTSSLWQYLGGLSHDGEAKVALNTSTLKLTQNRQAGSYEMQSMLANLGAKDAGPLSVNAPAAPNQADSGAMAMPKGWGGFLTGQAIDGFVAVGGGAGKADVDGWLISVGVDMPVSERFRAGVSLGVGEADVNLRNEPAKDKTSTKLFTVYGQYDTAQGVFLNGFAGVAVQSVNTQRLVAIGTDTFAVKGHASGTSAMFGLQIGTVIDDVLSGQIRPSAGLQFANPDVDGYTETGSNAAMTISPYSAKEMDLRLGFDANWKIDVGQTIVKPDLHLFLVDAAATERNRSISAALAVAPDTTSSFALPNISSVWAEVGVGAQVEVCDYASIGFHFTANPGRGDASYSTYTGSLKINF